MPVDVIMGLSQLPEYLQVAIENGGLQAHSNPPTSTETDWQEYIKDFYADASDKLPFKLRAPNLYYETLDELVRGIDKPTAICLFNYSVVNCVYELMYNRYMRSTNGDFSENNGRVAAYRVIGYVHILTLLCKRYPLLIDTETVQYCLKVSLSCFDEIINHIKAHIELNRDNTNPFNYNYYSNSLVQITEVLCNVNLITQNN